MRILDWDSLDLIYFRLSSGDLQNPTVNKIPYFVTS